ncbi:MAG TPA: hypothetical protein VNW97_04665 [Candidatus Saccharimonadales bacterium]|jgi:hypothetical protein|nr:hypothetical protein [Candidatus Saccharimonadales bacterium]
MTDTLKSICGQCAFLLNPQLEFVPRELQRQRELILRDLQELTSAASLEHEKSVTVMSGCLFESVLYTFIQGQSSYIASRRGSFTFNPEHNLNNYVSIFNRWFSGLLTIPDSVVDYRDMVHINRELTYPPDECRNASREMLRLLDSLLRKLAEYSAV